MIWSARKQYYLGFWAFLELKSVYILIKTCQSEGFILTQYILGNFQHLEHSHFFFEGIWNNYVDIQQKNMQVRFITFLHVRRCNSLSHPSLHYEVRVQTCLNMNWSTWSADSGQIVHLFIFNPVKNVWSHIIELRTGFCSALPSFCVQLKWCSGNLHPAPLILLLFHNKWKFYRIFQDSLLELLTTFVKLALKMQF